MSETPLRSAAIIRVVAASPSCANSRCVCVRLCEHVFNLLLLDRANAAAACSPAWRASNKVLATLLSQ